MFGGFLANVDDAGESLLYRRCSELPKQEDLFPNLAAISRPTGLFPSAVFVPAYHIYLRVKGLRGLPSLPPNVSTGHRNLGARLAAFFFSFRGPYLAGH